jgi:DMSO/TMAO reductase YedYZ molybdopterin-dependent catalytic subunit
MSTTTPDASRSGDSPDARGARFSPYLKPYLPLARRLGRAALDALPALAAGVVASLVATALMLWLRLSAGIVTLPELVGERVLPTLDANTFIRLLIQFGKIRPLIYTLLGQIVLGILVAPIYPVLRRWLARRLPARLTRADGSPGWPGWAAWLAAGILAFVMWLVALALFWPVLAENTLGFPVGTARAISVLGIAAIFASYALVLVLVYQALLARRGWPARLASSPAPAAGTTVPAGVDRRLLLRSGLVTVAGLALGGIAVNALLAALNVRSNLTYEGMETFPPVSYITPNANFYDVSKNVIDPIVDPNVWALEVTGLVAQPKTYDLRGLRALPSEQRVITLECIANGVPGTLISNAVWRGVSLAALLAASGHTPPGASQVVFTGADGYVSSLPLADLLAAGTLLAYEMNGVPLPDRHGFPLRAIVPGRFGEQSAKWITRLEIVDHPIKGFYQEQGWYSGPLYTISRIDNPGKHAKLPVGQTVHLNGIAFGGTRGIQLVELSTDNGASWHPARFQAPQSSQTWVLWNWDWTPPAAGAYTLVVRATDGAGGAQITTDRGTVPDGGTGLHRVPVTVG